MGSKGSRKYLCLDCGEKSMQSFYGAESNRKTGKPRCTNCGSTCLEVCSRIGMDDHANVVKITDAVTTKQSRTFKPSQNNAQELKDQGRQQRRY